MIFFLILFLLLWYSPLAILVPLESQLISQHCVHGREELKLRSQLNLFLVSLGKIGVGQLHSSRQCLELKSRFDYSLLIFFAPYNHASEGTPTLVFFITQTLCYGWVWGSVESSGFWYLLPSLVLLKYNSDVTSLFQPVSGLLLQFFDDREGHYLLRAMGRGTIGKISSAYCLSLAHSLLQLWTTISFPLNGHDHFVSPQRFVVIVIFFSDPTTLFMLSQFPCWVQDRE